MNSFLQKILELFSNLKIHVPKVTDLLKILKSHKKILSIVILSGISLRSYMIAWQENGVSFSLPLFQDAIHSTSGSALQGDAWSLDEQTQSTLVSATGPSHQISLELPKELQDRRSGVICIVVTGLGVDPALTQEAFDVLPPSINFAFSSYSPHYSQWFKKAEHYGHESLLEVPMEPIDYPNSDPGPETLLTALPPQENLRRLNVHLQKSAHYQGVINTMGGRFLALEEVLFLPLRRIKEKALIFVDTEENHLSKSRKVSQKLNAPFLQSSVNINPLVYEENVEESFERAKSTVENSTVTVLTIRATPKTIKALDQWVENLKDREDLILLPLTQTFAFQRHLEKKKN